MSEEAQEIKKRKRAILKSKLTQKPQSTKALTEPKGAQKVKRFKKFKKCSKCGQLKLSSQFPAHSGTSDGKAAYCNQCKGEKNKELRTENEGFRLKHHIATRVLKQIPKANQPSGLTVNLETYLGYKIVQLKGALNSELGAREGISLKEAFEKGYHLDHIKPLSSFHPTVPGDDEFKACWAIDNLRMISAQENLAKGATYDPIAPTQSS